MDKRRRKPIIVDGRNAELCDLNKVLGSIGKLISKRSDTLKIEDFDSSEREQWERAAELVEYFLWKVCLQQTRDVAVAAAVVTETRCDFIDKLRDINRPSNGLEWLIAQCGSMLVPFNVWLFLRARRRLRETDLALEAGMLSSGKYPPLPPKSILVRGLEWLMKLPEKCPLGNRQMRRRNDPYGMRKAIRQILSAKNCPRVCDVLKLASLGFTLREIGTALGINKDLADSAVVDCETRLRSMKQADAVTTSGPEVNKPVPEEIV